MYLLIGLFVMSVALGMGLFVLGMLNPLATWFMAGLQVGADVLDVIGEPVEIGFKVCAELLLCGTVAEVAQGEG